ncbi:MAG: hypothetical protein OER95_00965 [Acidimicrobiia bacterium]|nr:hypothetical protein [Acidimicrobiia bacterium]
MARLGVFPGSFNPPTIAHLAIAEEVRRRYRLDRLDLVISQRTLAKEHVEHPLFHHRLEVLHQTVARYDWLRVEVTDRQLLADIAEGYDVVVMGADKWWQIHELRWYESVEHRNRALAQLPPVAVFPRHGFADPPGITLTLIDDGSHRSVSSTRARAGELELMTEAAREFARRTGAWIDRERYESWLGRTRNHRPSTGR